MKTVRILMAAWTAAACMAAPAAADTALERRAEPGDWLEVSNYAGSITIAAGTGETVRIFAEHSGGEAIRAERRGQRLTVVSSTWDAVDESFRIDGDQIRIRLDSGRPAPIAYRIEAPSWMPLRAVGPLTSVTIDGMRQGAEVVVARGNVTLRDAAGTFEITAQQGTLTLERVSGRAEVIAADCDVIARSSDADLFLETTTGRIRLRDSSSARARATSVAGSIEWHGPVPPLGNVTLATHSGDIEVVLPEGAGLELHLRTFRGQLESSSALAFPPSDEASRRLRHTFGDGGGRLTIETFDGNIRLVQADTAAEDPP